MAERKFFTGTVELIRDPRPSALDLRVYACVSLHDGMSLMKGKGAGCFASNVTLSARVGCDYTSLSKSLNRLAEWGYITKERQAGDKRCTTYRCVFEFPDSWLNDQLLVGEMANQSGEIVGRNANDTGKLVGRAKSETRRNQPQTDEHYIPLRVELDSVETEEIDSPKVRDAIASRGLGVKVLHREGEPLGETLAKFERQFKADWTPYKGKLAEWAQWLRDQSEYALENDDNTLSHRAQRLAEDVEYFGWEIGEIADDDASPAIPVGGSNA